MSESAIDSFKLCIIFTGYIPIIPILTGGSDGSGGSCGPGAPVGHVALVGLVTLVGLVALMGLGILVALVALVGLGDVSSSSLLSLQSYNTSITIICQLYWFFIASTELCELVFKASNLDSFLFSL